MTAPPRATSGARAAGVLFTGALFTGVLFTGALTAGLLVSGCGSPDDRFALVCSDLPDAPGCGGDVVGRWTVTAACSELVDDGFPGPCTDARQTVAVVPVGSIRLREDGTVEEDMDLRFIRRRSVPTDCLPAETTCTDVATIIASSGAAFATPPTCTTTENGCRCYETQLQAFAPSELAPSTWQLAEDEDGRPALVIASPVKPPSTMAYCVDRPKNAEGERDATRMTVDGEAQLPSGERLRLTMRMVRTGD